MSNVKTLTTLSIAMLLASPALAETADTELTVRDAAESFASADLNQDGSLDSEEFIAFTLMRSDQGEAQFKDIVIAGQYDAAFLAYDRDVSGGVEFEELGLQEEEEGEETIDMKDEEPTLEPVN